MNIDLNELFFWLHEDDHAFPNILENSEGEDPIDWLVSEVKKKPVKIVKRLMIIGEVIDLDPANVPALFNVLFQFALFVFPCLMVLLLFALIAYAHIGTFMSFSGRSFRYIFIGGLAEKSFIKLNPVSSSYKDGSVIWGWRNRMWPFSKIQISEDTLTISTGMSSLEFPRKDINELKEAWQKTFNW